MHYINNYEEVKINGGRRHIQLDLSSGGIEDYGGLSELHEKGGFWRRHLKAVSHEHLSLSCSRHNDQPGRKGGVV